MVLAYGGYGFRSLKEEVQMTDAPKMKKKSFYKRKGFWVFVAFLVSYAFVLIFPFPQTAHHAIEVGPQPTTVELFGSPLNNTFFALIISTIFFSFIIIYLGTGVKKQGSTRALLAEMLVVSIRSLTNSILGKEGERYEVVIGTFFGYILISNFMGLLSSLFVPFFGISSNFKIVISPTTDLMVTAGFALCAIIYFHTQWIRVKGLGNYLSHYIKPYAFMLPINILEEVSRPLSLAVRLFGNITGEHIVLEVITSLVAFAVPIVIMGLGLFTGFVQALVFSMLFLVYLQPAISSKGGH